MLFKAKKSALKRKKALGYLSRCPAHRKTQMAEFYILPSVFLI